MREFTECWEGLEALLELRRESRRAEEFLWRAHRPGAVHRTAYGDGRLDGDAAIPPTPARVGGATYQHPQNSGGGRNRSADAVAGVSPADQPCAAIAGAGAVDGVADAAQAGAGGAGAGAIFGASVTRHSVARLTRSVAIEGISTGGDATATDAVPSAIGDAPRHDPVLATIFRRAVHHFLREDSPAPATPHRAIPHHSLDIEEDPVALYAQKMNVLDQALTEQTASINPTEKSISSDHAIPGHCRSTVDPLSMDPLRTVMRDWLPGTETPAPLKLPDRLEEILKPFKSSVTSSQSMRIQSPILTVTFPVR